MSVGKLSPHFTVLGPGGVGGLLAGLLARAGERVTVVAGEATAEHIAANGVRVESVRFGDFAAEVPAVARLSEPAGVLIVAPKATALDAALDRIPPELASGALVVPLLNGLEHVEHLRRRLPGAHVVAAAIRVESTRVAPGHIRHTSPFTTLEIATPGAPDGLVAEAADRLRRTGFTVTVTADEARTLWEKLHFLLPTALVCTHAGLPLGRARAERRADLTAAMAEVAEVAAHYGVRLDTATVLRFADAAPPATKPSMLRDREAGRPMEVDALGGALLRAAERAGVGTPVIARLVADLERVDLR
ncbi:ketopantoate reductase family protein [Marinactinospora rubrisoli]|uniref:2-dehydropantoate 2-reductase n=1 Tax=Marinactinospora rubrisoli TaxID=2715399 RepID=A0ABW2KH70_9ACTN